MVNRRIEMYEYRQIIYRLRKGQSNRSISRETSFGRDKVSAIKRLSAKQGWLLDGPLPDDAELHKIINAQIKTNDNSRRRKCDGYEELINQWVDNGISAVTIHNHLVKNYNFTGAYNSVQR